MSSELHKYIEKSLEKKQTNLFNAEVINFPNENNLNKENQSTADTNNFWKINDKSNHDQLKAVTGICFMFVVLVVLGLYSNLI